jgi:hypothetical protein
MLVMEEESLLRWATQVTTVAFQNQLKESEGAASWGEKRIKQGEQEAIRSGISEDRLTLIR